jgi:hypothetical protein
MDRYTTATLPCIWFAASLNLPSDKQAANKKTTQLIHSDGGAMKASLRIPVLIIFVMLLVGQACSLSRQQPPETQPTPTSEVMTLPPTPIPTMPPTPLPTLAGRLVTFDKLTLLVPMGISQSEQGQIVPGVVDGAPWDVPVQHVKVVFSGYPLQGTTHQPAIYVFPTAGFDNADAIVDNLRNVLSLRPEEASPMPFLPPSNAAQMFTAQMSYMDFDGGSGVRYLTQLGQGFWPINNQDLVYTYQGLTDDGRYYISVIMPVSNTALPASGSGVNLDQLASNFASYVDETTLLINERPEDTFAPRLADLDALVQSIIVK